MLSVIGRKGPTSTTIEEVGLVTMSGPEVVTNGTMTDMGNGEILVTVVAVPQGEFVLILKGTDTVSNSKFQRQSTTQMSVSKVNIQVCSCSISSHLPNTHVWLMTSIKWRVFRLKLCVKVSIIYILKRCLEQANQLFSVLKWSCKRLH